MHESNATVTPDVSLTTKTFENPSVLLSIKKENKSDNYKRFVQFTAGAYLPIKHDNSLQMSDAQITLFLKAINAEIRQFLNDGFDPFVFGETQIDIPDEKPVKQISMDNVDELIPMVSATIGDMEVNAVDAQELHTFLGVKDYFAQWITRRIKKYGFEVNSDFCTFLCKSSGGRKATGYYLTLDMAKELCMVENNKKGRQARRYFIACEKKLKDIEGRISGEFFPVKASELVKERDRAIKTKAEISDKKTATALGRVGNMSRKIKSLEITIKDLEQKLRVERSQKAQVSAALESTKQLLDDLTPMFRQE